MIDSSFEEARVVSPTPTGEAGVLAGDIPTEQLDRWHRRGVQISPGLADTESDARAGAETHTLAVLNREGRRAPRDRHVADRSSSGLDRHCYRR
jgi:hypothetical protein